MLTGTKNNSKQRVAFLLLDNFNWKGGFYYIKNLLHAVSTIDEPRIKPLFFVGRKTNSQLVDQLSPYSTIIYSSFFDRYSLPWIAWRIIHKLTGSNFVINYILKKHKIDVLSHSNLENKGLDSKIINWIPDFQHVHLPEMFSEDLIKSRNRNIQKMIANSDVIIVSSDDAKKDAEKFLPEVSVKSKVLRFVSKIDNTCYDDIDYWNKVRNKYLTDKKFFYLPNQFWKHKNHLAVFNAVRLLKKSGSELRVYCSGPTDDYRNKNHIKTLNDFIKLNNLESNIILLGLVDRKDVFFLMRHAIAVINPSLFEGWSSTVEESKSMGKAMILSDINVHREQAPPNSEYFAPNNPKQLAEIMYKLWSNSDGSPDLDMERQARQLLPERIKEYGEKYQRIVLDCL